MKLDKTLGEILYELFGPNGTNARVQHEQIRRMAVFRELERHGLVRMEEMPKWPGLYEVKRTIKE
jgi:hypothetical protein